MKKILITGGAGFIGSNLVEYFLSGFSGHVVVLDNFSTGTRKNLDEFSSNGKLVILEGDIRDPETCLEACRNVDYVLHLAALGSIPRSIDDPVTTNAVNISGFVNMIDAARKNGVKRFVYTSSSSVYGNDLRLPKKEEFIGEPLSPYAVTKRANELYAKVFSGIYDMEIIGLRLFNVFGPKQKIDGPYAAVIPIFIREMLAGKECRIFGDGTNTRDFTFVKNVVKAISQAAFGENPEAHGLVFNIACGGSISVKEIYYKIAANLKITSDPVFSPSRKGDIASSIADITLAGKYLDFSPEVGIEEGLDKTISWYVKNFKD